MLKRLDWPKATLTTIITYVLGFASFLVLFGNPISRSLIYTSKMGQSDKLLSVWFTLEPSPAVTPFWDEIVIFSGRKLAVLALLFLWTFSLVLIYATVKDALPGQGWRKGLAFGALLWATVFLFFEVFFAFNLLGEPLGLVIFELGLEVGLALVTGVTIAAFYRPSP